MDPELLKLLACPSCKKPLDPKDGAVLACTGCGKRYPIRDGIPILLVDEALEDDR